MILKCSNGLMCADETSVEKSVEQAVIYCEVSIAMTTASFTTLYHVSSGEVLDANLPSSHDQQ